MTGQPTAHVPDQQSRRRRRRIAAAIVIVLVCAAVALCCTGVTRHLHHATEGATTDA